MSSSISRRSAWLMVALAAATPAAAQQTVELPRRDVALKERPADVFTVGAVDGADWEMFSGIRSVAFDRSDNLYLLDGQNLRILVFDARGRFVRQFGKKGGGPGELQAPLAMDIAADGNVVVSDLGNRAFIVFTPTGEHVRNVPFAEDAGFPMGGVFADAKGGIVARSGPRIRPDQGDTGTSNTSPIYRQQLADGAEPQTIFRVPVTPPKVTDAGSTGGARRFMAISMDPVFGPRPSFGVLPSGLALHYEPQYAIRILDANGRVARTLTRDYKLRKVTKKDQEKWQEQRREAEASGRGGATIVMSRTDGAGPGSVSLGNSRSGAGPGSAMRMSLDDVPFAETMAVVTGIRTDPQGRIWVQRRHEDNTNAGPIDLVTGEGRYIGTLPPQPLPNAVSASGLAAWVITDELGVERVAVRRLPAGWR